jgi:hypothetical protein
MSHDYWYIGKDNKPILARTLEDQRDAALEEVLRLKEEKKKLIIALVLGEISQHYLRGLCVGIVQQTDGMVAYQKLYHQIENNIPITDRPTEFEYCFQKPLEVLGILLPQI